jgi:hypothetical protein
MEKILYLYSEKLRFGAVERKFLKDAIENGEVNTDDLKNNFIKFINENFSQTPQDEVFNDFINDHYSNLLSHFENLSNLLKYYKIIVK